MVSPLGIGAEHNWQRILNGETNIQAIPEHWHDYIDFISKYYSPIPDINFKDHSFTRNEILQKDKVSLFSNLASQEAFHDAGIELELIDKKTNQYSLVNINNEKAGVSYGTGGGGADSYISNTAYQKLSRIKKQLAALVPESNPVDIKLRTPRNYNPFTLTRVLCHSVGASNSLKFNIKGVVRTTAQACSSGTTAIGVGYEMIKNGLSDIVLTGGAENCDDDYGCGFYSFDVAKTLVVSDNQDPAVMNRPFDKKRNGFLFSPGGAGSLILESEAHMENRAATPIAEVLGFAETFDAHSIMAPEPEGKQIERMMTLAIRNAELSEHEIDYINAHGTSTIANDQIEADAIIRVFGNDVAVNSTKSIIGHTTGASGAIEAIVSALSIRDQELHPSLNLENPIADLDFVTERRNQKIDHVLSHSFAFGGHNSGIILGKV